MRAESPRPMRVNREGNPDFWHEHGPSESARLHSRRSSMGMHGLGTAASIVWPASAAGVEGLPGRNTVLRAPALPTPATHFWGQVPSLLATVPRKRPAPNSDHSPIFVFRTLGGKRSSLRARLKVAYGRPLHFFVTEWGLTHCFSSLRWRSFVAGCGGWHCCRCLRTARSRRTLRRG